MQPRAEDHSCLLSRGFGQCPQHHPVIIEHLQVSVTLLAAGETTAKKKTGKNAFLQEAYILMRKKINQINKNTVCYIVSVQWRNVKREGVQTISVVVCSFR